eukprot:TRINITY_DN81366_c0_g1_i1.p1 TRINITY_DN81366_c0_g1~~TRINITY_DN81366_c0_g1_i1.p1  ORF type:complete len:153 (-),score=17.98 TRINITY_DN81366_c0_g1_i1:30-461(-)
MVPATSATTSFRKGLLVVAVVLTLALKRPDCTNCFSSPSVSCRTSEGFRNRVRSTAVGALPQESQKKGAEKPEPERGAEYYAGMFTSPMKPTDAEKDMLTPNLKLVAIVTLFSAMFLLIFSGLNGPAPSQTAVMEMSRSGSIR